MNFNRFKILTNVNIQVFEHNIYKLYMLIVTRFE